MGEGTTFESVWAVPDTWQQGRGAWGGLPIRRMVEEVVQCEAPAREVRSITAQIPEPVLVGSHQVVSRLIRKGSAMSMWQVDILREHDNVTVARGQVVTGVNKNLELDPPGEAWGSALFPHVPPAEQVELAPVGPPFGPVFGQHLEYRPITPLPQWVRSQLCMVGLIFHKEQNSERTGTQRSFCQWWMHGGHRRIR